MEIDSQHTDMVHDAQFDFYSKQLATCSSDKTIRIHTVNIDSSAAAGGAAGGQLANGTHAAVKQSQAPLVLKGHSGPVWQVAWSHPVHNSLLASCSYDGKVIIWNKNQIVHEHEFHTASVNSIAWAPHKFGPVVACASSDGKVSVLSYSQDNMWTFSSFTAHSVGVNSVSFCPSAEEEMTLVTGGCDCKVKVWKLTQGQWQNVADLEGHSDWVRSVAWSPLSVSSSYRVHTIASCSPDKTVCIWTSTDCVNWEKRQTIVLGFPLWRVSWSVTGHLLAVAGASDQSLVYAVDSSTGEWTQVSSQAY